MDRKEREERLRLFLVLCHEKITEPCESAIRPFLTPSQFYALCAVNYYGAMTMTRLAGIMNIPKQNATKLADRLIETGFAARQSDAADRRMIRIEVTGEGKRFIEENVRTRMGHMLDEIESLGEPQASAFFEAMGTLNQLFQKMTTAKSPVSGQKG